MLQLKSLSEDFLEHNPNNPASFGITWLTVLILPQYTQSSVMYTVLRIVLGQALGVFTSGSLSLTQQASRFSGKSFIWPSWSSDEFSSPVLFSELDINML